MKITDLDEFQGLAGSDVHTWMLRNGWKRTEDDLVFERGATVLRAFLNDDLLRLAAEHRLSTQALLREINPRMRDGWPSETALDAHDGWVIWVETVGAFAIWDSATVRERKERAPDAKVRCWPCDANGNKVRWPTDEYGNML